MLREKTMDATIGKFLTILKASLEGKPAALTGETTTEEWRSLLRMAETHHVLPLFYGAVYRESSLPADFAGLKGRVIRQVASQTMHSLYATNEVCTMPVYRPCIGLDKQEIVEISEKINTYETSINTLRIFTSVFLLREGG